MKRKPLTYKEAGVNIAGAEKFVKKIKKFTRTTKTSEFKSEIGGFGAVFDFFKLKIKEPVLISSTDGVGTKLKIAFLVNKHHTVGVDLVAMNVNDILTTGAMPLFFLDYISTSKINIRVLTDIVRGISRGCREAGCSLIGGELAEMPGFYKPGEYDLAGFCTGVVEKKKILTKEDIKEGDVVIGLASNGLHSNGFSLVRKVFTAGEQKSLARELLRPTRIYVKPVISLLRKVNSKSQKAIKAMAHVTGGAFYQKVSKVLPKGKNINIYKSTWPVPGIFKLIEKKGHIKEKEMFSTFNMGIGFVLIAADKDASKIIRYLTALGVKSWVMGEVVKGKQRVIIV